ncbi:MAG: NUDIX domain-containing protein, partial [Rhodospirillales bacterium]|nr:NUDIX domain-containing protein [Rhodospirillales bacterium]
SEAAIREVREETGLEVLILGLIDVVDSIDRDDSGGVRYHYTLVDLLAAWRSGEAVAGDDAVDAAWFHLEDLDSLDLWEETHRIIRLSKDMMDALG